MTIIALDLSSLDGANGFGISGINAYDLTGMSVSGAGDFNGDGIDDVIVSSGGANAYAGISHVVFGSTAGFPASLDLSTLDGVIGFNLSGAFAGGNSGIVVSDAGDVNADGLDDVIIGAPFESDSSGSFDGRAYVVFGATSNFPNVDLSSLDGASGFAIDGAGGGFGRAVSSAGDVNGDGVADIVIGQPFNGPDNPGTAYVVYGSSSGFGASFDISALDGTNGFTISGAALLDFTGLWVSGAGDVNGDGLADIVIGAPTPPNAATSEGRAYVVFGSTAGFAANIDLSALDGSNGFAMNGIALGDGAGARVSDAGDINGDGIGDIVVSAYRADRSGQTDIGEAYVVFGSSTGFSASIDLSQLDGSTGFIIGGSFAGDATGNQAAAAGDFNGDGIDDLLVGAWTSDLNGYDAGAVYVVFGSTNAFPSRFELSEFNGSNAFVIKGANPGDVAGRRVSAAGDVNGDGIDDIVVGAFGVGDYVGASYVIFGSTAFGADVGPTPYDDSVLGTASADDIDGLAGHDTIIGFEANDVLTGGQGFDFLFGESGDDSVFGGDGNDVVSGWVGDDSMSGGAGDDLLIISYGADTVQGDAGNDRFLIAEIGTGGDDLDGGADADQLDLQMLVGGALADLALGFADVGGAIFTFANFENVTGTDASDTLIGDAAANLLHGGNGGNDSLVGGDGDDYLYNEGGAASMSGDAGADYLVANDGNDTLNGGADNDTLNGGAGVDSLLGGLGADSVLAGAGGDRADGGDGNDAISGEAGNDSLLGNLGNDSIVAGNGVDTIMGGADHDSILGEGDNDVLNGDAGNDTVDGGLARDVINGGAGFDLLVGGVDNDTLSGGSDDDALDGGAGNDSLLGGVGLDTLGGGAGADTLNGGADIDWARYVGSKTAVSINLATGVGAFGDAAGDLLFAIENVEGTVNNDTLVGNAANNVLFGLESDDTLSGANGADILEGGQGRDSLVGGNGADILLGATENDSVLGGAGNDALQGDDGSDSLDGGADSDTVVGGAGNDTIRGGAGNDSLLAEYGRDTVFGDDGDDRIDAAAGDDVVDGGLGRDSLFGGTGVDSIVGGGGNDTLQGGAENDTMLGGAGFDILLGGDGDDSLDGGDLNDVIFGNAGNDVIVFQKTGDTDTIRDFAAGAGAGDVIRLVGFGSGFDSFAEVLAAATDNGVDTTITFGGGDVIILRNVLASQLAADDFIFG